MTKVYINQQPTKSVLSIVLVNSNLPLSDPTHHNLLQLCKETDVMFLMSPGYGLIDFNKFTALYQACGWVEASKSIPVTFVSLLEYEKEIWEEKHPGILITSTELLDLEINISKVKGLVASDINKPIMKCREMNSQEFYGIYKTGEKKRSWSWWFVGQDEEEYIDNRYSTYTSESRVIILRPSVTNQILSFWETSPEWIKTFGGSDIRPFISSVLGKLDVDVLGLDYDETEGI